MRNEMAKIEELAAPCGLFCGACPVFKATENRELAEKLVPRIGLPVEMVRCRGCHGEEGKVLGKDTACVNYQCITARGYTFCYECPDFPCLKLAPAAHRADAIPHNQKVYNLVLIQKLGLEKWAEEVENIWRLYFRGKKGFGGDELKLENEK
jgi:hypothetical protein